MRLAFELLKRHLLKIQMCILSQVVYPQRRNLPYVCRSGTYLHTPWIGPEFCLPCTDGINFMPKSLHREKRCFNCTQVRDENLEVLVSFCNKTHDAEILCRDGYYRYKIRNVYDKDTCVRCSDCEHVARPCQGYYDTVCCLPSYEAVWNKNGFYECKERPILCGAGEFLSLKTEQCTPCPPGTFMTSNKHNHTNCQVCQTLADVGPHQEIVQHCNRTHPAIFGCQAGYYKDEKVKIIDKYNICWPCGQCERTLPKFGLTQDSVCCDGPNVRVHETKLGKSCLAFDASIDDRKEIVSQLQEIFCGKNEYLQTAVNGDKACLPCPEGTFQTELVHEKTVCTLLSNSQENEFYFNSNADQTQAVDDINNNIFFYVLWCLSCLFFIVACILLYKLYFNSFKCIVHHKLITFCGFLLSIICLTVTFLIINLISFIIRIIKFVGYVFILFAFKCYARKLGSQEEHEE